MNDPLAEAIRKRGGPVIPFWPYNQNTVDYTAEIHSLLNQNVNIKYTDIRMAVITGQIDVIKLLIKHGASVNSGTPHGWMLIHDAVHARNDCLNEVEVIKLLIKHKINIHIENVLHMAASNGRKAVVELLIDLGIDRTLKDERRKTAADLARTPAIKRIILTRGISWSPPNHSWRATETERTQIKTLMMIRNQIDNFLHAIPPEIMFELFGHLVQ